MIRIVTKPIHTSSTRVVDTKAMAEVKAILDGAESEVDTEDTQGVRNLIRRALADSKHTATALPDGRVVMNTRGGIQTIGHWMIERYVTMDSPSYTDYTAIGFYPCCGLPKNQGAHSNDCKTCPVKDTWRCSGNSGSGFAFESKFGGFTEVHTSRLAEYEDTTVYRIVL